MKLRTWKPAILAIALAISATQTPAQSTSLTTLWATVSVAQGDIDPTKTELDVKKTEKTKTETTSEYDKDGKLVRRTTKKTEYTGRESDPNRKVKKTTTEVESYDSKGKKYKTTTTTEEPTADGVKKKVEVDPAGAAKKRTELEEELDAEGKVKKKTEYGPDGKKMRETEYDADGKPKKETYYDSDGNPSATYEDFDKDGRPRKVTTHHPNGQPKKESALDGDGRPTTKREFDDKGREIKRHLENGDEEETEYEDSGKIKRKTVRHKDGSKSVTDYRDGQPGETRKYDPKGKQMSVSHTVAGMIVAPDVALPGESFQFTVATMTGEVLPNTEVTLDGGALGAMTTTTDLNGVATIQAPKGWNGARLIAGAATAAILFDAFGGSSGRGSAKLPAFVQPGGIVSIPAEGMTGALNGQEVFFGGRKLRVLAASSNSIKALVPIETPLGAQGFSVLRNGRTIAAWNSETVRMKWDALGGPLAVGQSTTRALRIEGSESAVEVVVHDVQGDAVEVVGAGTMRSSGGAENVVNVRIVARSAGAFKVPAELRMGSSDFEKLMDRKAMAHVASEKWIAEASSTSVGRTSDLRRGAGLLKLASGVWERAAKLVSIGEGLRARKLEAAATQFEAAAMAAGRGDAESADSLEALAKKGAADADRD